MKITFEMLPDECWWGGCVVGAEKMPFDRETVFSFDLKTQRITQSAPLYLSSKSKLFPMTMSVYQFFGKEGSYWNYVFADIVLTIIPVVAVYAVGQRYIIGGVTAGAVKG